ncbi:MAG: hypothetical protein HYV03_06050 [Deltaproteobacteria bacterium]|nr:hypothetical protein [Deltaproteobacteria bacterium]
MTRGLSITTARQRLLALPDILRPGEGVEIYRHRRPVMKLTRLGGPSSNDPFAILDAALHKVPPPFQRVPKTLARNYKRHLYGKKR